MKQHDFNPTGDITAKRNSGYNLPITWHNQPVIPHRKAQKMEIVLWLDVHCWYLWKPFLLISTETDDDSSNCLRRTQWFSFFSSAKPIALGCIGERKKQRCFWLELYWYMTDFYILKPSSCLSLLMTLEKTVLYKLGTRLLSYNTYIIKYAHLHCIFIL